MKVYVFVLCFFVLSTIGQAQNFSGQWKGIFLDKSTSFNGWGGDKCEYVIDLDIKDTEVSGYSYTYFNDAGKRYYTICRLSGKLDKKKKYIEVTEVERTKTNVPASIRNCFQVHRLTWSKTDSSENLSGSWAPAPNQDGNCGFGLTSLDRRTLTNSYANYRAKPKNSLPVLKPVSSAVAKAKAPGAKPVRKTVAIAKTKVPPKAKAPEMVLKPINGSVVTDQTAFMPADQKIIAPPAIGKRSNYVLKTLVVDNEKVNIDLYDNGEVDGDSISVYYNNKLLLGKKRLTEKAITLTLPVGDDNKVNELVMYAENLGTIPPNTALMVVTDGTKRYEVRITSDLQKSGTIRFVHKSVATE